MITFLAYFFKFSETSWCFSKLLISINNFLGSKGKIFFICPHKWLFDFSDSVCFTITSIRDVKLKLKSFNILSYGSTFP